MSYRTGWDVRFGDVDAAGIVYYPRLFDRVVRAVEESLSDIGQPVAEMVDERVGMPIVNAEADLERPIRLGDKLTIEVIPTIRETSVVYNVEFSRDGDRVATARQTMVTVDLDSFEPTPVPADVRHAIESR